MRAERDPRYERAFADWLACAVAGRTERAAQAVRAGGETLLDLVAFTGTAGHVLDLDDTLPDGVAHVSAAVAPAALVLAAALGRSLGEALTAYAAGFEAMSALAAASHPALYDNGWHPTAVCGPLGAAVAAATLLGLDETQRRSASAISLLRAGGTRGAFGSDGKALQVGMAAAAGVEAAHLALAGARVGAGAIDGVLAATGASWAEPDGSAEPWIARNWCKLHPSCLGTHAPIDAAAAIRGGNGSVPERLRLRVSRLARQAAHIDAVSEPLEGKFSIPYCVAFTLRHGEPRVADFTVLDAAAARAASAVEVCVDPTVPAWGCVLESRAGEELVRLPCPRGAPERPLSQREREGKIADLAGPGLLDALHDPDVPARAVLVAAGLDAP